MKAITLCAGMGRRMLPLTETTPKCLLDVKGKSLLERQCDALEPYVEEIIVVEGYLAEHVRERLGARCSYVHNNQFATTNSIYSLWLARHALEGEAFVLANGDVLFDDELLSELMACPFSTATLVDPRPPFCDGEMNVRIENGRIVAFSKTIRSEDVDALSLQLIKFSVEDGARVLKRVDDLVSQGKTALFPAAAYDLLMAESTLFPVFRSGGRYVEIDTPADLNVARREFRK